MLYAARACLGSTEECLYVCLWDPNRRHPQWFTLWINPNQTLTKKKTIEHLLVPMPSPYSTSLQPIVLGSEIYIIGGYGAPSSDVRVLDCRSHTWHNAPSMNEVRNYASASVYNGKIYAMGGVKDEESSYAEVFDTKTRTWECLPEPPSVIYNSRFIKISEVEGKIYVRNVKTDYAYDLKRGEWECCNGRVAMAMTSRCCWYDIKNSRWEEVKGLDALNKYRRNVDSICSWLKLVSLSEKLLAIWDECMMDPTRSDRTKIWCAEIVVEKRDGGDIWGKLKWVHVVHTAPFTCQLLHCLAVTL